MAPGGLKIGHPATGSAFFEDLEEVAGTIGEMLIDGGWVGSAACPDHINYWVGIRLVALEMRGCRPI